MPLAKTAVKEEVKIEEIVPLPVQFTMPDVDRGIYEMLEIYGKETADPDTQDKVKFIQEALGDQPKDNLLHIITELGATPLGETKMGRVYKYLRLKQQADKALKHFETINREINFMRDNRWA